MGIDQGGGRRRRRRELVMVQHDDVHTTLAEPGDRGDSGRAAIHREQQRDGEFSEAILDPVLTEAIAFIHTMGQVIVGFPAEGAEHFEQQGSGRNAVNIVIAEDDEGFIALAGLEQALDGHSHVGQQERVG